MSIHESYRESGRIKKKQTVIYTIGYYEVVDWGNWPGDFVVGGLASKADALGLEESRGYYEKFYGNHRGYGGGSYCGTAASNYNEALMIDGEDTKMKLAKGQIGLEMAQG